MLGNHIELAGLDECICFLLLSFFSWFKLESKLGLNMLIPNLLLCSLHWIFTCFTHTAPVSRPSCGDVAGNVNAVISLKQSHSMTSLEKLKQSNWQQVDMEKQIMQISRAYFSIVFINYSAIAMRISKCLIKSNKDKRDRGKWGGGDFGSLFAFWWLNFHFKILQMSFRKFLKINNPSHDIHTLTNTHERMRS